MIKFVNFHNVGRSFFEGVPYRSWTDFIEQINFLKNKYRIISLKETEKILREGSTSSDHCVITFDDALECQKDAYDYLFEKKIPFISFIPTRPYIDNDTLLVHKLQIITAYFGYSHIEKILKKKFSKAYENIKFEKYKSFYRYDTKIAKHVKFFLNFCISSLEKAEIINILFDEVRNNLKNFQNIYLKFDTIKYLAKLKYIGSHTHSHQPLEKLKDNDIAQELKSSKIFLERISEYTINWISYPYGGSNSVSQRVFDIAKKSGYEFGLTMHRGINDLPLDTSFFLKLKRFDTNDVTIVN